MIMHSALQLAIAAKCALANPITSLLIVKCLRTGKKIGEGRNKSSHFTTDSIIGGNHETLHEIAHNNVNQITNQADSPIVNPDFLDFGKDALYDLLLALQLLSSGCQLKGDPILSSMLDRTILVWNPISLEPVLNVR